MAAQGSHQTEKRLCVGLLAHVDAGKTTLSEAMLYQAGVIRAFGRVDHGDTSVSYTHLMGRELTLMAAHARPTSAKTMNMMALMDEKAVVST